MTAPNEAAAGLVERFSDLADKLENLDTLPKPYNLYYAVKNEGSGTGWRYVAVDIGVSEIREAVTLLAQVEELRRERDLLGKMTAPDAVVRLTEALLTVQDAALDLTQRLVVETARANDAEARATTAEALVAEGVRLTVCLIDNEPDNAAADGGITVLDVWRKAAAAFLQRAKESRT